MAQPPEIKKGTGPDALPQGEATQLNDALASTPAPPDSGNAIAPAGPQPAAPADFQPKFVPATPDEQYITGPTTRPDESLTQGANTVGQGVSPELRRNLPALVDAASQPGADPNMLFLADFLIRAAGQ